MDKTTSVIVRPIDFGTRYFDETQKIENTLTRIAKRDDIVNKMYSMACAYDVPEKINSFGKAAAFLVTILAKLNGYEGDCINTARLDNILKLTCLESSGYIRNMARKLISFIIQKNVLSGDDKNTIVQHLCVYSYDGQDGILWVWEGLIALCPLSETAFIGSMIAQCVGDALGFIVEGQNTDACKQYVHKFVDTCTIPDQVRVKGMTFGQYSDDSQLARETYVSVVQAGGKLDPAVYGLRIGCLFQPGHYRIVGYGATTARAGEALYMGKHHSTTGSKTTSGNGSAMRSGPLGLILSQMPIDKLVAITTEFSSITHASTCCIDGSIAIALGTRAAMATRGIKFNIQLFLSHIASFVT